MNCEIHLDALTEEVGETVGGLDQSRLCNNLQVVDLKAVDPERRATEAKILFIRELVIVANNRMLCNICRKIRNWKGVSELQSWDDILLGT
jgi:hypothetical protein